MINFDICRSYKCQENSVAWILLSSILLSTCQIGYGQCSKLAFSSTQIGAVSNKLYAVATDPSGKQLGAMISDDHGSTWTKPADLNGLIFSPPPSPGMGPHIFLSNGHIFFVACIYNAPTTITFGGDQGAWKQAKLSLPCGGIWTFGASGNVWILCAFQSCSITKDGGNSWAQVQVAAPNPALGSVPFLHSTSGFILLVQQQNTNMTYIGRFDPQTMTWSNVSPLSADILVGEEQIGDGSVFGGVYLVARQLLITKNGGDSWIYANDPTSTPGNGQFYSMNGEIFTGTSPGLYYSKDFAATWSIFQGPAAAIVGAGLGKVFYSASNGTTMCTLP